MISRPRFLATATLIGVAASLSLIPSTFAFVAPSTKNVLPSVLQTTAPTTLRHLDRRSRGASAPALNMADNDKGGDGFEVMLELPGEGLSAQMKFPRVLNVPSEIVQVRYKLPFGLDVAPKDQLCVCNKAGEGGERVGDILRYTSQWTFGLPRGDGVITTAMSFSGGISWQVSMFDVMRASKWEDVVDALTSNAPDRCDEVVLLFERALPARVDV